MQRAAIELAKAMLTGPKEIASAFLYVVDAVSRLGALVASASLCVFPAAAVAFRLLPRRWARAVGFLLVLTVALVGRGSAVVAAASSLALGLEIAMLDAMRGAQLALAAQAITDPLTGAFNRRHLESCLAAAIERRARTGEPASLLLFDVDHFKRVNDGLGHAAGDALLERLAALVVRRARRIDALFRVGGEEFVLLLAGAGHAAALSVADDLRMRIATARLIDGVAVSISVGVSELRPVQSGAAWLADADAALYRAKQAGRNRVAATTGAPREDKVGASRRRVATVRS